MYLNFPAWHRDKCDPLRLKGVRMNKLLRIAVASVFLIVGQLHCAMAQSDKSSIGSSVSAADEAAVRAIIDRQTDAWNKHDMAAFVADAMPDVDWINVVGMHWKGRDAVMKAYVLLHTGMFESSHMLTPEVTMMREIAPNVIVETHVNRIEGVGALPSGAAYPTNGNLLTLVIVKTQSGWRIAHAHNTTMAYDRPKKDWINPLSAMTQKNIALTMPDGNRSRPSCLTAGSDAPGLRMFTANTVISR
jgi:uncharacterized protein (TIGR02246 family)